MRCGERRLASSTGPGPDWERRRLQLAQEQEKQVGQILDHNQLRRFKQITLQSLGPAAFREPEVIAALNLTIAQCERIRAIEANTVVTFAVWFSSAPRGSNRTCQFRSVSSRWRPSRPKSRTRKLRTSALTQIQQEVLKPEQMQRWREMIGEPVDGTILAQDRGILVHHFQRIGGE